MPAFTVDVTHATHEQLRTGDDQGWVRVSVEADNGGDAILIACQIVAATHDTMPIDAVLCV